MGSSLAAQWLGHTHRHGLGSIPCWGTKILQCGLNKEINKSLEIEIFFKKQ